MHSEHNGPVRFIEKLSGFNKFLGHKHKEVRKLLKGTSRLHPVGYRFFSKGKAAAHMEVQQFSCV